MLEKLCVQNFAIIEDLTVEFHSGMTVLTGETGAGKSLIIDTISLLLGARADSDMIRYGQNMARVEGIFESSPFLTVLLGKYGIPPADKITVLREIYDTSKNSIKINQHTVSLAILKNIAVYLADIHIQNDTYRLFNPENDLELLDPKEDEAFDHLLAEYSRRLYAYLENIREYEHIVGGQKKAIERLEFLKYEYSELSALNLTEDIDTKLEERIAKLSNYDRIFTGLSSAYSALENDGTPIDRLYEAAKSLEGISAFDKQYQDFSERLLDFYYVSTEIKDEISKQLRLLDYDEEELNGYITELNEIHKAKEKYKKTVPELIAYIKEIALDIEMTTNYEVVLEESRKRCEESYKLVSASAKKLSDYRRGLAKNLAEGIVRECRELDLEHTKFEIQFEPVSYDDYLDKSIFTDRGCDKISFTISFNKGEPLKPLHKVASGGEMSRIMLAFKSYFSKSSRVSLMVFDEIDTGVSGATAKKIAFKMHEISKYVQVLCITHLPQVAAIGDYHKHIYKIEENNRTITQIKDLNNSQRIEEIALMLSGDKLSLYALEHAKSLLNNK